MAKPSGGGGLAQFPTRLESVRGLRLGVAGKASPSRNYDVVPVMVPSERNTTKSPNQGHSDR